MIFKAASQMITRKAWCGSGRLLFFAPACACTIRTCALGAMVKHGLGKSAAGVVAAAAAVEFVVNTQFATRRNAARISSSLCVRALFLRREVFLQAPWCRGRGRGAVARVFQQADPAQRVGSSRDTAGP